MYCNTPAEVRQTFKKFLGQGLTCQVLGVKPRFQLAYMSDVVVYFNYLGYSFAELHIKLGDYLVQRGEAEQQFIRQVSKAAAQKSVYQLFDACSSRTKALMEEGRVVFDKQINNEAKYKVA